jgi:hypothetical protein
MFGWETIVALLMTKFGKSGKTVLSGLPL